MQSCCAETSPGLCEGMKTDIIAAHSKRAAPEKLAPKIPKITNIHSTKHKEDSSESATQWLCSVCRMTTEITEFI